jgi:hypothetical protein
MDERLDTWAQMRRTLVIVSPQVGIAFVVFGIGSGWRTYCYQVVQQFFQGDPLSSQLVHNETRFTRR